MYDWAVANSDLQCNVFHGFETCSLLSMKKAKSNGAKIVLDEARCHEALAREVMTKEYEINGFDPPKHLNENDKLAIRKRNEYEQSDYIITCAEFIRKDFIEKRGFNPDQVFTVPLGVNTERFTPGIKNDSKFRIISIGTVGFGKGTIYLLEAFKQLKLPNSELLIISPVEDDFKCVMRKYEGIYKYIESVPNQELVKYYTNSSVFILPSILDSFGFVTTEAMASGLPVIVSENCGFQGRNGVDGFTIPIRNIDALKEKILYLYNNEKIRQEMGINASVYIKQFSWERYHNQLMNVYESIIN